MKSTLIHMDVIVRNIVVSLFLLAGIQAPLLANQMWEEMFNDNLENAKAGEVEAQYEVGIMYLKGQGVDEDRKKAIQWLNSASDAGNEQAAAKLRRMDEQQEKFAELQKQASAGDAEAQYEMAMMYLKGRGTEKDETRARLWLGKASELGYEKAITRLGILHYRGEGGKVDYEQAYALFDRVKDESVLAQYYMGEMYAGGEQLGIKKDELKVADDRVAMFIHSPDVARYILERKEAPLIVKHLSDSPTELEKLGTMNAVDAAAYIATTVLPKARKLKPRQSNAPDPLDIPGGRPAGAKKDAFLDSVTFE